MMPLRLRSDGVAGVGVGRRIRLAWRLGRHCLVCVRCVCVFECGCVGGSDETGVQKDDAAAFALHTVSVGRGGLRGGSGGLDFRAAAWQWGFGRAAGEAVLEYAFAVWLVAMLTLPKRLTRAPVQPVVFHRKK